MPEQLDRTTVRRKMGEAYAAWYWAHHSRNDNPEKFPKEIRVNHALEYRKYRALLPSAPTERNGRGNLIYRDHDADVELSKLIGINKRGGDRYLYDFDACTSEKGWQQFDTDQDASYFGVWVHREKRTTFTYAEGDRTLVVCEDDDHFREEIADMERCYGSPPPAMVGYGDDGRTEYYSPRLSAVGV